MGSVFSCCRKKSRCIRRNKFFRNINFYHIPPGVSHYGGINGCMGASNPYLNNYHGFNSNICHGQYASHMMPHPLSMLHQRPHLIQAPPLQPSPPPPPHFQSSHFNNDMLMAPPLKPEPLESNFSFPNYDNDYLMTQAQIETPQFHHMPLPEMANMHFNMPSYANDFNGFEFGGVGGEQEHLLGEGDFGR